MPSPRRQSPEAEINDERNGIFWTMLIFLNMLFRAKARTANNSENQPDEIQENGKFSKYLFFEFS